MKTVKTKSLTMLFFAMLYLCLPSDYACTFRSMETCEPINEIGTVYFGASGLPAVSERGTAQVTPTPAGANYTLDAWISSGGDGFTVSVKGPASPSQIEVAVIRIFDEDGSEHSEWRVFVGGGMTILIESVDI